MPIYEYQCNTCKKEFEELVFKDEVPPCPHCDSNKTSKLMSRPCYHMAGGGYAPSSGGSCAGCAGGNCATCG